MTKSKLDEIYSSVCPNCGGFHANAQGGLSFSLDNEIEKLVKQFYNGHNTKATTLQMASKVAATLAGAVDTGYAKGMFSVDWESPDRKQIQNLQQNVYHFSFAKCNEQLKATTAALHHDGKIVPFGEFKEVATRINNEYTVRHLPVEYNFAVSSAQMGSRWVQFQEEKETLSFLTYRTVGDANVRTSHQALDGVTRSIDDKIWDTIFTPNGWGCRCDIEQSIDEEETPLSKIAIPTDIPAMFKTNLAKTGLIFPDDHPYFDHLPDAVIKAADNNNPFLYEKAHVGKKGGYVYNTALHNIGKEYAHEIDIAKVLANTGERVVMLPEINPNPNSDWKDALRNLVLPDGIKNGKNADAILNGKQVVEFKTSKANTIGSIKDLIKEGSKQADTVCVKLTNQMPLNAIKQALKGQVNKRKNIKEVWVIDLKDKLVKYDRAEIADFFKIKKQK